MRLPYLIYMRPLFVLEIRSSSYFLRGLALMSKSITSWAWARLQPMRNEIILAVI